MDDVDLDVVEVDEVAVVGDALHREQAPRRLDGLAHRLERVVPVHADLRRERLPPGAEPELDPAGREVVERRERRGEEADVARPGVDDARADADPLGHGRVGGHRHGRLADEPALGLPDRLEAAPPRRAARSACRRGSGACPAGRALRGDQSRRPSPSSLRLELVGLDRRPGAARGARPRRAAAAASSSWSTSVSRRSRDDPVAGDHHVAHRAAREAEDPVARRSSTRARGAGAG